LGVRLFTDFSVPWTRSENSCLLNDVSHSGERSSGSRQEQKARTRRALLDAGLRLLEEQSLSSLGLREITRAVRIAPAAFYRHFRDIPDLGVALVAEALGSVHEMVGAILAGQDDSDERIEETVEAIARYVRDHRAHLRFVSRERHGSVRAVREAIAAELSRFADEVATALAPGPTYAGWDYRDMRMLSELYVDHMVTTAAAFLETADADEAAQAAREHAVARTACRQLKLIRTGCRHWPAAG
jgi:AcrR family transcriptional regulator